MAAALLAAAMPVQAVESDPLPVPAGSARAAAVSIYNESVALLVTRRFADAQARFEAALALDDCGAVRLSDQRAGLRRDAGCAGERAPRPPAWPAP